MKIVRKHDLRLNADSERSELRNSFVKAQRAVAMSEVCSNDKVLKVKANQRFRVVRSVLTYSTFGFLLRRGHRRQLAAFLQWAKANCPFTVSLLLTGSRDNLYRPFSPHFTIENLKNRRRRLKGFTTLLSS